MHKWRERKADANVPSESFLNNMMPFQNKLHRVDKMSDGQFGIMESLEREASSTSKEIKLSI